MYALIDGKKFNVLECSNFLSRFKSLKFALEKIDYILKFPKKRGANTYFFCQRVDICFTDKDDKILYLYSNVKSEKFIFKFKSYNVYYMPLGSAQKLQVGEVIKIKSKK